MHRGGADYLAVENRLQVQQLTRLKGYVYSEIHV